jgi:hypothetical protein
MSKRTCSITGCDRPEQARKMCMMHYHRVSRWGDPDYTSKPGNGAMMKFLLATYQLPIAHDPGWPGSLHHTGYGYIRTPEYGRITAARYVAILTYGPPDPPELEAAHDCPATRACFWAKHIRWATHAENMADTIRHGTSRARKMRS